MEFPPANTVENAGVSTGNQWIKTKGDQIASYSPVDGKLIGSVSSADRASYDATVQNRHFRIP